MDLDNIFSTMDHNERNPLKDSELKKELEELFRSECLGIEEDPEVSISWRYDRRSSGSLLPSDPASVQHVQKQKM